MPTSYIQYVSTEQIHPNYASEHHSEASAVIEFLLHSLRFSPNTIAPTRMTDGHDLKMFPKAGNLGKARACALLKAASICLGSGISGVVYPLSEERCVTVNDTPALFVRASSPNFSFPGLFN